MPLPNQATAHKSSSQTHVRIAEYSPRTAPETSETARSFWCDIHPLVARRAQDAYEAGNFLDATNQALMAVHDAVQERVRHCSGIDLDGETLMNRTFAPGLPIIELDDLSTPAGRNTHEGFLHLFAGSMTAFSALLAGGGDALEDRPARHIIYLASLLMCKLDELSPASASVSRLTSTVTESFTLLR